MNSAATPDGSNDDTMPSATEALGSLRAGNARFVAGRGTSDAPPPAHPPSMSAQQRPFAIILGCSDSRVPAEIVFDQGLGDLFVIRVAGNIVAPSQVGSVEFAATAFGTPLVVVLGHTRCGAVDATIDSLRGGDRPGSPGLRSIVDRIRPAVAPLLHSGIAKDPAALVHLAVRANIAASAGHLRHGSAILEELIEQGRLLVVGAEYDLDTGVVEFLND